ncbi:MAG: transposase [Bacteroidota bacterium]
MYSCDTKEQAFKHLAIWYNDVEAAGIEAFGTVSRSVQHHYEAILRYFNNKSIHERRARRERA